MCAVGIAAAGEKKKKATPKKAAGVKKAAPKKVKADKPKKAGEQALHVSAAMLGAHAAAMIPRVQHDCSLVMLLLLPDSRPLAASDTQLSVSFRM
jgi:hypothetical protein